MKKGVIVYITGEEPKNLPIQPRNLLDKLNIPADRIEFISGRSGHFDIHNAAWELTVSGMQQIICMTAEFTDKTELRLTGREMRFCG